MDITLAQVTPFMDPPPPAGKAALLASWLTAISAKLTKTFGDTLPAAIAPAVYDIIGVALNRRLSVAQIGADPRIKRQSTGPSSVEYNTSVTGLSGWFWPSEANELGELFGYGGSLTSIRTSAPDGIRFGNLAPRDTPGPTYYGEYFGYGYDGESELPYGDQS